MTDETKPHLLSLEEMVKRVEEKYGFDSRIAQMYRDQLAAEQQGMSAREIYLGKPVE